MFDLFRRKHAGTDVLGDAKTVTRWLHDLPTGDMHDAQERVVQLLIQFNRDDAAGFGRDRLQVLMQLDEKTRDMQDSLCQQYLRNARMSKAIEARLWTTLHAYYWEVTRAYHGFVMDFLANPGNSKLQPYVAQITARCLRGFADIMKWRYFRYEKADAKLWLCVHNLYRIAEFDRFASTPVTVYPDEPGQRTAAEEYLQALLLSPFSSGNLAPKEIEMVDRWLDHWSNLIRIDGHFDAGRHGFYVDIDQGCGLVRCDSAPTDANLRFLETQPLLEHIHDVREALKSGASPVSLGLTEDFRVPEGYGLLHQAETAWAGPEQGDRRRSPRRPQSGRWRVIQGLADICAELGELGFDAHKPLTPAGRFDIELYGVVTERNKAPVEDLHEPVPPVQHSVWEQNDVSDTGIAFLVDRLDAEWVKIGLLIAMAPLADRPWRVGVVSRLASHNKHVRLIGIRFLAGRVQAVGLRPEGADGALAYVVDESDLPEATPEHQALLLSDVQNPRLIIDGALYSHNRQYDLRQGQDGYQVIRLESVDEAGDSWLSAVFKVVSG